MDASSICVTIIVTIFGIAFPILFQVITRLDEKYSSILIIEKFRAEKEWKIFQIALILSLCSILVWIFRFSSPTIAIKWLSFLIENSAILILISATIFLTVLFFLLVLKINIYYTPYEFVKYLIAISKKENQNTELPYMKLIGDALYFSIKEQNETISKTITDYLYRVFKDYREMNANGPIEYPYSYYELVYKSTQELAALDDKKIAFLIPRTVGGIWLLGELKGYQISEKTYFWLWRNLIIAINYDRDDMILSYWANAHQFFSYNLDYIHPKYSYTEKTITNKEDVEKRKTDRQRFLEFHYALGGLLLYKQRHNCIKRLFNYTSSIPPKYELLPESMNEIFTMYIQFRDPDEEKYAWISHQYPFPDTEGLESNDKIKHWICQYIALLFLRQYSIIPYLSYMKPLEPPTLPDTQKGRKEWMDNLDYFEKLIEKSYNNEELKSATGLNFLTDNWCKENNQPHPIEFIKIIKTNVEREFEATKVNQEISKEKIDQFNTSTKTILTNAFKKYNSISNASIIDSNYNSWYIHGSMAVIDKSPFAENQEADHVNFDTFLSEMLSSNFEKGISETFFHTRSLSYLVKPENLFAAVDRLKITDKNCILVCFGINIQYYKEYFNITQLDENKYKNIDLINFTNFNHHLVDETIFILKKSDLPRIEFKPIEDEQIEKYTLVNIDRDYNIYTSIIDLNINKTLLEELKKSHPDDDLQRSAFVFISFKSEIIWKKGITNTMLRTTSIYHDRGLPNEIKEIEEFK